VGDRPLVAVVGSIETHGSSTDLTVPEVYIDAVERAGGAPVALYPVELEAGEARRRLEPFQSLLLIGGGDLDPSLYGQAPGEHLYGVNRVRDVYEVEMLRAATEIGMPVLAICRGLQLVNVARGGSLDQHITDRDGLEAHGVPAGGNPVIHEVRLDPESDLFRDMGVERVVSSCHHHQAVATLGEGLRPVAWTDDGIVEGLEDPGTSLVAVQWHPEDTAAQDPAQQRLFDSLVERSLRR
jgi:putative glutamine amidotransferase